MLDPLSLATLALRLLLVGFLVVGLRRRNLSVAANAAGSLAATFLPAIVEYSVAAGSGEPVAIDVVVPIWIGVAGVLHMVGMAGWYDARRGWDHVTHLVSAGLVAAVVYGAVHGIAAASPEVGPAPAAIAVLAVVATLAVGVFWELVELVVHRYSAVLGVESVLIPYGRRDAALDLVFDVVGALVVVWLDVRVLEALAARFPSGAREGLLVAGGVVVVGSLASVLLLVMQEDPAEVA